MTTTAPTSESESCMTERRMSCAPLSAADAFPARHQPCPPPTTFRRTSLLHSSSITNRPPSTVPGQSVSPPPMLTPRLGAMPLSTPLGSLALDPQESSNKPDSCDTAGADITDTTQDTPMPASKSAPLGIPEREDLNRSPSPALTVSNG